jgi:quercetin dioxygenase-like cupin family protein
MSAFSNLEVIPSQSLAPGLSARSTHGAQLTLTVLEFEPDTTLPEPAHPNEQLGLLIAGTLELEVASERRTLRPGGTWCIPAQAPHSAHAGPAGAVVVEGFAPPRSDWESLPTLPAAAGRWP